MNRFSIDNRTLQLLKAQVNLSETFNHTLRNSPERTALRFRLNIDRGPAESSFVVEMGNERHTLTLANDKKTHLKLADFIEDMANGPIDTTVQLQPLPHAEREYGKFSAELRERVFGLVCLGGFLDLDMGFSLPIRAAIHRTRSRAGATIILSIGHRSPRTKCFTVHGSDTEIYKATCESINHLAALATPAAHAA
ncbi:MULTISPECIES: hypothetical protein [unclassified Pseudomonas]|uniref:hypothetical protein n=1 Tax=unclassified Pseudomonas TaxID=196821 RepID=UPI000A1F703D|nr:MULTISPECIES: hypothetical protein [unclassified Pseudomonas]